VKKILSIGLPDLRSGKDYPGNRTSLIAFSICGRAFLEQRAEREPGACAYFLSSHNPRQQIGRAVSGKNYPSVSNPARTDNVAHRKHGSGLNVAAILIPAFRNADPPTVTVKQTSIAS